MAEWVRIRNGGSSATMAVEEWQFFVELRRSEESPGDGWHEVVKDEKPTPGEGQTLAFMYTVKEDGKAYKTYELVPSGTRYAPVVYSKLKLYATVRELGLWADVKAWLEEADLWDAFVLAQDVRSDNEQFSAGLATFKKKFGLADERVEEILAACVAEGSDV